MPDVALHFSRMCLPICCLSFWIRVRSSCPTAALECFGYEPLSTRVVVPRFLCLRLAATPLVIYREAATDKCMRLMPPRAIAPGAMRGLTGASSAPPTRVAAARWRQVSGRLRISDGGGTALSQQRNKQTQVSGATHAQCTGPGCQSGILNKTVLADP